MKIYTVGRKQEVEDRTLVKVETLTVQRHSGEDLLLQQRERNGLRRNYCKENPVERLARVRYTHVKHRRQATFHCAADKH